MLFESRREVMEQVLHIGSFFCRHGDRSAVVIRTTVRFLAVNLSQELLRKIKRQSSEVGFSQIKQRENH
jgi:hypothetical protein